MTSENVDLVLSGYARYNAGERIPSLDAWHEDAEYHAAREDPDSAVHRGIHAIRRHFATWHEAYRRTVRLMEYFDRAEGLAAAGLAQGRIS